ncbi:hypothetical protein C8T65DRAFT_751058 [Cerioporus squamosus]|nr:hypothetical protein C8T65DRAFT_751058 [Cerioporus squamosus]
MPVILTAGQSIFTSIKFVRVISVMQYLPWAAFSALRIIYFVSIAILNALHLALTALSTLDTPLENSSLVTYFTEPYADGNPGRPVPPAPSGGQSQGMDLQSSIHSEEHGTATLVFARAVGSLVSSLGPEEDTEYSGDTEVLLRDGTIYFITLFIVNSLSMIFSSLGMSDAPLHANSMVPRFTEPLTASLILRFLIHIQSVNQQVNDEDLDTTQGGSGVQIRSLLFQRVVGSIGSSLDPSFDDYEDEGGGTVKGRDTSTSDYDLSSRSAPPDEDDTKEAPDHVAAVGLSELSQSRSQEGIQSQLA